MLSRREWIGRLLGLTGLVVSVRPGQAAEKATKISKTAAKYQDHPHNMQMCGMCRFFIPPGGQAGSGMMGGGHRGGMMTAGTCKLVEGRISPMGWCVLYHPISR